MGGEGGAFENETRSRWAVLQFVCYVLGFSGYPHGEKAVIVPFATFLCLVDTAWAFTAGSAY